ncbi:TPA: hypothetical protein DEB00_00360 [Candidatus Uhrbacteria bacterium]|nr:hypothetical protein [Candidatus Uhrbacteria bacterium]
MFVDSKGVWELVVGWDQEARACTLREILRRAWMCYRLADQLDRVGLLTEALRTPSVVILPRLSFINEAERLLDAQAEVAYMATHKACPAQCPRELFYDEGPPTQHGVVSIEA